MGVTTGTQFPNIEELSQAFMKHLLSHDVAVDNRFHWQEVCCVQYQKCRLLQSIICTMLYAAYLLPTQSMVIIKGREQRVSQLKAGETLLYSQYI